ncbi:hypothetical protein [Azospirillum rugosum]|uniref:Diguanylate cyclase n=1 Tax=Azospirillum rugosum TaxID=416170 RepID=A0ABS4SKU7_9PROT|nr:hypothetical protein [Azospirillum rugosum]MBP2293191.1 hypothetical protein [Azospirillum rugosum]MDQ0526740.1 hypothetical protein [Azospirillum rugosum]
MKQFLLTSASFVAITVGATLLLRSVSGASAARQSPSGGTAGRRAVVRPPEAASGIAPAQRGMSDEEVRTVTRNFLLYFVIPLWLASGVADWLCHRTTDIQHTTGAKETMIHLLMLVEMGVPTLAGLFLEINSPVLALMVASFLLHEATALWDVSYAVTAREVTPIEQHVHSFLEMLPLMAVSFIAVMHWPKALALVGLREDEDRGFRLKRDPLPTGYIATLIGLIGLLEVLPYLEEMYRDWRAHPGRLMPPKAEQRQEAIEAAG